MALTQNILLVQNINTLIEASGLTDEAFSNLMGFSLRKLKYIKAGKTEIKLKDLEAVSQFFNVSLREITARKLSLEAGFRNKLLKFHHKNKELVVLLEEQPSIVYSVKNVLIKDDFFKKTVEIKEIKHFLLQYGWAYTSSAISMAMLRMPDLIKIEPHPTKKGTFVYSRK
ncbi:helix-turn-helix domain-containing protein [Pedobacter planticolens]|nr:helix-turn-helix transcriptional regulator [Pedobacter planticolens]